MYAPTIGHRGGGGRGRLPTLCIHICLVNYACTHVSPTTVHRGGGYLSGGEGGQARPGTYIYIYSIYSLYYIYMKTIYSIYSQTIYSVYIYTLYNI